MENAKKMTIAECQVETIKHIENVRKYIKICTDELTERGIEHDRLKLESPEVEIFTTMKKMSTALKYGVSRVSINTQTTNDEVLRNIGRRHTAKQYFEAFEIAREAGIPIINTDLIAGFSDDTFEKSLEDVIGLSPENLTVHTLCVKNSAGMRDEGFVRRERGLCAVINDTYGICHNNGYFPYYLYKQKNAVSGLENVGYSKKGCECIYNICMMSEINSTVAMGAGASTKIVKKGKITDRTESFFDCKYPKEYIENREKAAVKAEFLRTAFKI